ncbi:MAG: polyphenol oxidase family protein [Bdellovibrionales bacterium]|nr:polyphenol oxidase family protein [Bdellovibrionales bacterium]
MMRVRFGFEIEKKGETSPLVSQVHGDRICSVDSPEQYQELLAAPPPGDGVQTRLPQTPVYVFAADCVPLLFYSENPEGPVAAVHCGWRGAAARIAARTLDLFHKEDGDVHVVLGPYIHGDRYEVREDFVETFQKSDPGIRDHLTFAEGRMLFDVARYVLDTQLASIPPSRQHLEHATCTYSSDLPSYRRNGNTLTRLRSWIEKVY